VVRKLFYGGAIKMARWFIKKPDIDGSRCMTGKRKALALTS
jgi:hypothetical protein